MQLTLVTARYAAFARAHPTLHGRPLVPVRTSIGLPKFIPVARHWPRCSELVPWSLLDLDDHGEFEAKYRARLDAHGLETIRERLTGIWRWHGERPLALLCFEPAGQFCHRRIFAAWWHEQTGEVIDELAPAIESATRLF
jgi:hypothetical protein